MYDEVAEVCLSIFVISWIGICILHAFGQKHGLPYRKVACRPHDLLAAGSCRQETKACVKIP